MSLAKHREELISAGLMVPNPDKLGAFKYAPGYTAASAAAELRVSKGAEPKAPKGLKFATTTEGATVLVPTTPRKATPMISTDYSAKFTNYCRGADEPTCKARPGCSWQGGKVQRCQRGIGKQKSQSAQKAEKAAAVLQALIRGHRARKELKE